MSSILWITILFLMCSNTLCAPQNAKKMRENDEKEAGMIDENMTADDRYMESPLIIGSTSSKEIAGSSMSFVSPASSPNFEETPSTTTETMSPRSTHPDLNQIRMRSALDSSSIKA